MSGSKILNIVKLCDFSGESVQFNIKRRSKSQTLIGGVLAIIFIIIILFSAWSTGNDILYKNDPFINTENQLLKERPIYNLDKYSFPMAFACQDETQKVYDLPQYFKIEIINTIVFNSNASSVVSYYQTEKCTNQHFPRLSEEYLNTAGIKNYYCLKNQNVTIGGFWDNVSIQYLILRLRTCNNMTDNNSCAPKEEIDNFMSSRPIAWQIYFQDTIINTRNYEFPNQYFLSTQYKQIKLSSYKLVNLYIKGQEIQTDRGWIFEDIASDNSRAFDYIEFDDADPAPVSLVDYYVFVSNQNIIYRRKYLKIQTIFANIGGLAKALLFILRILTFYFSRVKFYKTLANRIFNFEFHERNNLYKTLPIFNKSLDHRQLSKKLEKEIESNLNLNLNINCNKTLKINNINHQVKSKNEKVVDSLNSLNTLKNNLNKKDSSKNLKFSFCNVFAMMTASISCNKFIRKELKRKHLLYLKSKNILTDYMDIRNIVDRFEEMEKLKLILLNNEQLAMFQLMNKDLCSLENYDLSGPSNSSNIEMHKLKTLSRDQEKLITILHEYFKDSDNFVENFENSLNRKLYNLIKDEIRDELDKLCKK